jgi:hypothetical protein
MASFAPRLILAGSPAFFNREAARPAPGGPAAGLEFSTVFGYHFLLRLHHFSLEARQQIFTIS